MAMAAMYCGMYPAFKDVLEDMVESGGTEAFSSFFGPAAADMATYVGFINLELYQIFWIVILGILIGFVAASLVSKEIEGKTIDLLMSNPISRKQIIFEKFVQNIHKNLKEICQFLEINSDFKFNPDKFLQNPSKMPISIKFQKVNKKYFPVSRKTNAFKY